MGRPIDSQELRNAMYHEAFETDSDEQRWDGGCWIRYKMFERILDSLPSAQPDIVEKILAAGKEGRETRIYIGGRLFAVRELAQ